MTSMQKEKRREKSELLKMFRNIPYAGKVPA
jgi:hypothetical protein